VDEGGGAIAPDDYDRADFDPRKHPEYHRQEHAWTVAATWKPLLIDLRAIT
jgi:hypothetical protein